MLPVRPEGDHQHEVKRIGCKRLLKMRKKGGGRRQEDVPSTESSKGRMWTRFPYLMSRQEWTLQRSPSLTLRLFRATV
jgi:hypothetical protein